MAGGAEIPPGCEIIIDDLKSGINPHWTPKSFKGYTDYTWEDGNGKPYIRAVSKDSASGLIYEIEFDPQEYPFISWSWKVDNIISSGDAREKSTDDYGARVYVIFKSFFFWNTKAINYIWANRLPKYTAVPNPYTSNNMMISVESGPDETGKWLNETRNIHEDYIRVFGRNPSRVTAVAIMTDTDNTGEKASASYGPIAICSRDPRR